MDFSGSAKRGYHHGDLRNALAEAAAQLARQGGPDSVTVRAAARLAGVTPTAAYRHYAGHEELLTEAKQQCMARLGAAMEKEIGTASGATERLQRAVRNLVAAGRAYIDFALAEPGLFRTAFSQGGAILDKAPEQVATTPFGLVIGLLDELVEVGYLAPQHRPMAEIAAWSMTHGLAMLLLDGPLRDVPQSVKDEAIARTMVSMGRGLGELTSELERLVLEVSRPGSGIG